MTVFHVLVRFTQRDTDSDPIEEIYTEEAPDMPSAVIRAGLHATWAKRSLRGVDVDVVSIMDDAGKEYTDTPLAPRMREHELRRN